MSQPTRRSRFAETIQFVTHLHSHTEVEAEGGLDPALALLRNWQADRLALTYADLLTQPRYSAACRFFLSDLYGARDFSQRDHDIEHLYSVMARVLPNFLLGLARNAIELNRLTRQLDQDLCDALVNHLGVSDSISSQQYAQGYRICDNYAARQKQIDLIVKVGQQVDKGTRFPLTGATLRLARAPAQRAGWMELQTFLERGFSAFKQMDSAERFLAIIQQREMRILDQIFAGDPDPFFTG